MVYTEEDYFTENFVSEILRDVAVEQKLADPVYEIHERSCKGFGFLSYIIRVVVKSKDNKLGLIIKAAQQNEQIRKVIPIRPFYLQEIKYYKEILPAFESFQRKRNVKSPFKAYATCHKTMNAELNELLVFDNLNEIGFKVFDKSKEMDDSHVKLVLREYGKLHALSLTMKDQDAERFEDLVKDLKNPICTDVSSDMIELYVNGINAVKAGFNPSSEAKIVEAIGNFSNNIIRFISSLVTYEGEYGVITHGDCWSNNMMFKYQDEDPSVPIELCIFDFQIGTLTSPVLDLSYFLYSSMSEDMLNNLDYYLMIYHDSLRDHMKEMGSDVEKYYPFASLKEEWKVYSRLGFLYSMVILRVKLREEDEAVFLMDTMKNTGKVSVTDTVMKKSKNEDLINQRYRCLGLHMYENGFI